MFFTMIYWHFSGLQNLSNEAYRIFPDVFAERTEAMAEKYTVRTETNLEIPVVHPKPGTDIYMLARLWEWWPILELEKGQEYRLHLSSLDWQHGFSLQPTNINIQVHPGYEMVMTIAPTEVGEFGVVCNEFAASKIESFPVPGNDLENMLIKNSSFIELSGFMQGKREREIPFQFPQLVPLRRREFGHRIFGPTRQHEQPCEGLSGTDNQPRGLRDRLGIRGLTLLFRLLQRRGILQPLHDVAVNRDQGAKIPFLVQCRLGFFFYPDSQAHDRAPKFPG
jgi:cytochrome c oxidase subunit II